MESFILSPVEAYLKKIEVLNEEITLLKTEIDELEKYKNQYPYDIDNDVLLETKRLQLSKSIKNVLNLKLHYIPLVEVYTR
jgi:hypothetical protein